MKSKERPWALTKESPIHEVKKDHESPKSQKEGNNNNNKETKKRISVRPKDMQQGSRSKDMQQEEHQGPRTLICPFEALRRGPWLTYGKAKVCVQISNKKTIKNPAKTGIIFVTHGPSPWDPEQIVREKLFGWQGNDFW